ncbi:RNI-like protein [Ascodesmis nigricans]|uniref:RNI-like protein n=1 Tax=Ascodesmis nigricans TaxID=341454 RepID=A0A4S2N2E2_9PEZI|nr:RNI-like protein [Ascodesmis nigricans]
MAETPNFRLGQRLSYSRALCTVRYIGPIDGTSGTWLGVEWDDPLRGKHSGSYNEKSYFTTQVPNAASFIRPTRKPDPTTTFLEALRKKYGDGKGDELVWEGGRPIALTATKVFEEVGFEKIAKRWAMLGELKAVLLDGWKIEGVESIEEIKETCPNIEELDLSRNLLPLSAITTICLALPSLHYLRLNGLRFDSLNIPPYTTSPFHKITHLELSSTLLTPAELSTLLPHFPSLQILSLTHNLLTTLPPLPFPPTITALDLSSNLLTTLSSISTLSTTLPNLSYLSLSHNLLTSLSLPANTTFPHLRRLDISYNRISSFQELDHLLPPTFPILANLRIGHNTLTDGMKKEDAWATMVARVARNVTVLNLSKIETREREDAEVWYLGRIAREIGEAGGEDVIRSVVRKHGRWVELCQLHGTPVIPTPEEAAKEGNTLRAHFLKLDFVRDGRTLEKMVPPSIPVSMLRRLVARWFSMEVLRVGMKCELRQHDMDDDDEDGEDGDGEVKGAVTGRDGEGVVVLESVDDTREIGVVLEELKGRGRVWVEEIQRCL